jgi:hypothetical protein
MRSAFLAVFIFLFTPQPVLRADGYKFSFDGRIVPEREQRALIEWADGAEALYVAALSHSTSEGTGLGGSDPRGRGGGAR